MAIGYLPSSFDLINVRDLDLISQAVARCSRLIVGVLSDDMVERLSGRRPVVPLVERMALVRHVRGVDEAVVQDTTQLSGLDLDAVIFTVADEPAVVDTDCAVVLTATRDTESVILRHALRNAPSDRLDPARQAVA